ncbi:hypothetical protein VT03_12475 [Planctomyces sp. SH-PL14]|nr:hypothetical protein VT03_12475 [Planctomyces sp. SH-PL14]
MPSRPPDWFPPQPPRPVGGPCCAGIRTGLVLLCVVTLAANSASAAEPTFAGRIGLEVGPDTTLFEGPLDRDGVPIYLDAVNEELSRGVGRDENFWPLCWEAAGNWKPVPETVAEEVARRLAISIDPRPRLRGIADVNDPQRAQGQKLLDVEWLAMRENWSREDLPDAARWLDANATVLEQIAVAAHRPKAYSPFVEDKTGEGLEGAWLPHVQGVRKLVLPFLARVRLRLGENRADDAWQDLLTSYRIARHIESGRTFIEKLIAASLRVDIHNVATAWLSDSEASSEELKARWEELSPLLGGRSVALAIPMEKARYAALVLSLARGQTTLDVASGANPLPPISPSNWTDLLSERRVAGGLSDGVLRLALTRGDINATLRHGHHLYDDCEKAMRLSDRRDRLAAIQTVQQQLQAGSEDDRLRKLFVRSLTSSPDEVASLSARILVSLLLPLAQCEESQTRDEARTATLKAAFQWKSGWRKTGAPALSWEELTGDAALFGDPFTGEPLQLERNERGMVIWSLGANGRDDGGLTYGEGPDTDDLRVILAMP